MTPIVFDGCFGWLHPGRTRRGVVLCGSFGQEIQFIHRDWRRLAEELSAAGLATVRFDYNGQGDSPGVETAPGRLTTWVGNIVAAARWLQATQGVDEVILIGVRFGAALAAAAAAELGGVHGLGLLAPVASGRAHIRDLNVLSRIIHKQGVRKGADNTVEGVAYTVETMSALSHFAPFAGLGPPALRSLALIPSGLDMDRELTAWSETLGSDFHSDTFAGFSDLVKNADYNSYATEAFGRVVAWAADGAQAPATPIEAYIPPPARMDVGHAYEEAVVIDGTAPLFGLVTRPKRKAVGAPAVLFMNTGATSHLGAGRMWVLMARRFAELGLASLRFDVAGVGDSPDRPGQVDPIEQVVDSLKDVQAAMDWMEKSGYSRFVLVGFCRGSQLAYLASGDRRVHAQVLIGPPSYFWDEPPVHAYPRAASEYVRLATNPKTWTGVLNGQTHPLSLVRGAVRLTKRMAEKARVRAKAAETASSIRRRSRTVQSLLVVGDRDAFITDVEDYFQAHRSSFPRLLGLMTVVLPEADHLYLAKPDRDLLMAAVVDFLTEIKDGQSPTAMELKPASPLDTGPETAGPGSAGAKARA